MKIIDFHTHYDRRQIGRNLMDEADFVPHLERAGVAIACCFTMRGFFEDCRKHNDLLAERCRAHSDRLIPFATVDPRLGAAAVEELERCLSNPLFRGVKFHPMQQRAPLSIVRDTMVELARCAARHGVPMIFHDGTPPWASTFQVAAVARWVPEATIVLGHSGLADYVLPAAQLARDLPNLHACYCSTRTGDLECLVETAGADKVLFGSDFGDGSWKVLAERIDSVRESRLDDAAKEKVFRRNAERLLHLKERPLA